MAPRRCSSRIASTHRATEVLEIMKSGEFEKVQTLLLERENEFQTALVRLRTQCELLESTRESERSACAKMELLGSRLELLERSRQSERSEYNAKETEDLKENAITDLGRLRTQCELLEKTRESERSEYNAKLEEAENELGSLRTQCDLFKKTRESERSEYSAKLEEAENESVRLRTQCDLLEKTRESERSEYSAKLEEAENESIRLRTQFELLERTREAERSEYSVKLKEAEDLKIKALTQMIIAQDKWKKLGGQLEGSDKLLKTEIMEEPKRQKTEPSQVEVELKKQLIDDKRKAYKMNEKINSESISETYCSNVKLGEMGNKIRTVENEKSPADQTMDETRSQILGLSMTPEKLRTQVDLGYTFKIFKRRNSPNFDTDDQDIEVHVHHKNVRGNGKLLEASNDDNGTRVSTCGTMIKGSDMVMIDSKGQTILQRTPELKRKLSLAEKDDITSENKRHNLESE